MGTLGNQIGTLQYFYCFNSISFIWISNSQVFIQNDMRLEGNITFHDNNWFCRFPDFSVKANDLNSLDNQIIDMITACNNKGEFEIYLHFDMASIPQWYRQYMSHYFNRVFTFSIQ
jgi:hypothetical protein